MNFQQKLLLGVSGMVLPALLVGAEAIRSNALEQRALEALGTSLGRNRTYAELETAMFNQSEVIWRYLSGLDTTARTDFKLTNQVVHYWYDRWKVELGPSEAQLAETVLGIQRQFEQVGDSVFHLTDLGKRPQAYAYAVAELRTRLQPALTTLNRQVYRQQRENSVSAAFKRVEAVVETERKILIGILALTLVLGITAAWLMARSLVRPINQLRDAMAVVGAGDLDHPLEASAQDEIGDLARAFAGMTRQLRRTQSQLVQSEKLASLGEMAAGVAHGLRNPLASLRASAQLVLRHPSSPAAGEQLQAIIDEVDRLDRRITHLLTFSRPTPFQPAPEKLEGILRSVLPAVTGRIREQGVALSTDLATDLPEVPADAMKLEQALLELIGNALDAMPGGGALRIAGSRQSRDGKPGVELVISDTGRGIPPETLREVGQPFFTTRPEGTGLGLATARRFVEQHGGRVELESTVGAGTTARLWLPASGSGLV